VRLIKGCARLAYNRVRSERSENEQEEMDRLAHQLSSINPL